MKPCLTPSYGTLYEAFFFETNFCDLNQPQEVMSSMTSTSQNCLFRAHWITNITLNYFWLRTISSDDRVTADVIRSFRSRKRPHVVASQNSMPTFCLLIPLNPINWLMGDIRRARSVHPLVDVAAGPGAANGATAAWRRRGGRPTLHLKPV